MGASLVPPAPLPLPVARLHRRSFNAKSAKDRHDTAWYAWEVSVRIGVAAAPPANAAAFARASVGQWCAALKPMERPLADPALLALFAALTEGATGSRVERATVSPRELCDALPAYRNKVIGHGSARSASFYEASGRALLTGLDAAWREHLFLPDGARLVHVDGVALDARGGRVARVLDLSSETPVVVDDGASAVPESVLPGRLYLRDGAAWRALHPWLLYHDEDEQLWCFNGLARRAEYLDYASGETLGGAELEKAFPGAEAALRALLGATAVAAPQVLAGGVQAAPAPEDERRFGDYEVLGKLGEGGMGAVYLARQASLDRTVALKMLPPERAKDAVAVGRFQREVRALARCEHPNVVKIYASGAARGTHYYAMEFVDGADLAKVAKALSSSPDFESAVSSAFEIARGERAELFPGVPAVPRRAASPTKGEDRWRQMARFFAQGARGLAHLHENGIVHRDISPANIMVTWPDERAVIMDLGLAAVENASVTLTKDKAAILGTLRYIAPEQLQKHLVETDRRVDVYSFGATMYELFGGRPIFDGETEPRLIQQVLREEPRLLGKLEPRLPAELAHIVHKAIEKDPARRYASAAELADDLEAFLAGEPITARPQTHVYRVRRWVGRHKELVAGVSVGVVLAIAATAWGLHQSRAAASERRHAQALAIHETLDEEFSRLGSVLPADRPALESWVARAEGLIAGDGATSGLEAWRRELDALRSRGGPLPDDEAARRIADDPGMKRIGRLREIQAWNASIRVARWGEPGAPFDESKVVLQDVGQEWLPINRRAWELVDPDRAQQESEMVGLALARRALTLVATQAPANAYEVRDTLAWALFAAGRDAEALAECERAVREAPDSAKFVQEQRLQHLRALLPAAQSDEQRDIARHNARYLDAQMRTIERRLERTTTVRFDAPADQRRYDALVKLVAALEVASEPDVGRLARARRWLDTSRALDAARTGGAEWDAAIAAIRAHPAYAGLQIEPQAGLVPLGPDPGSKLWEFAHVASGRPPVRAAGAPIRNAEPDGIVLVLLPGGKTILGSQSDDPNEPHFDEFGEAVANGTQTVVLAPFFAGKFEVTQAQWWRMAGNEPSALRPGQLRGDRFATRRNPVERVSWDAANRTLANFGLDLPTEAQFEYALRAGTTGLWWTGDAPEALQTAANVRDATYCKFSKGDDCDTWDDGWMTHAPVGTFLPNPFGLHDAAGNVWEWCRDKHGSVEDPLADGDGLRRAPPAVKDRVVRGGGWASTGVFAKSAHRDAEEPGYERGATLGLRAARPLHGRWTTDDGRSSAGRE